ncbi:MAG: radical SAM protein [Polyangiales bacterium]
MTARATVRILSACDNHCVFCGQQGLPDHAPSRADVRSALESARAHADEVTLTGGEPTLHPELPAIIEEARSLGFSRVGVQTNGRLARGVLVLKDAGLTDVHLSIHGGIAAAHDYHTGVEGSFVASIAALSAARAAGLDVAVTTVLTRSNGRGLADLARVLAARNASIWCISIPRVRGRAAEIFDRVVPRLGIAMPFALHAMQVATSLRLPVFVRGAPSCLLGPFAKRLIPSPDRAFAEACNGCAARAGCAGVEPEYLARFAGDELAPTASIAPEQHPLTRLFVGEGEVAAPRDAAVAPPPAVARVALPMLGKVQPARAEVPRSAEKKTGAALRELFKDLYTEGEPDRGGE